MVAHGFLESIIRKGEEREAAERGTSVDVVRAERAAEAVANAIKTAARADEEREREAVASAAFIASSGLPFRFHIAVAYHPQQGPNMHGGRHIVLDEGFADGRLPRVAGQTLCSTRPFWGLERMTLRDATPGGVVPTFDDIGVCPACRRRAEAILARRK